MSLSPMGYTHGSIDQSLLATCAFSHAVGSRWAGKGGTSLSYVGSAAHDDGGMLCSDALRLNGRDGCSTAVSSVMHGDDDNADVLTGTPLRPTESAKATSMIRPILNLSDRHLADSNSIPLTASSKGKVTPTASHFHIKGMAGTSCESQPVLLSVSTPSSGGTQDSDDVCSSFLSFRTRITQGSHTCGLSAEGVSPGTLDSSAPLLAFDSTSHGLLGSQVDEGTRSTYEEDPTDMLSSGAMGLVPHLRVSQPWVIVAPQWTVAPLEAQDCIHRLATDRLDALLSTWSFFSTHLMATSFDAWGAAEEALVSSTASGTVSLIPPPPLQPCRYVGIFPRCLSTSAGTASIQHVARGGTTTDAAGTSSFQHYEVRAVMRSAIDQSTADIMAESGPEDKLCFARARDIAVALQAFAASGRLSPSTVRLVMNDALMQLLAEAPDCTSNANGQRPRMGRSTVAPVGLSVEASFDDSYGTVDTGAATREVHLTVSVLVRVPSTFVANGADASADASAKQTEQLSLLSYAALTAIFPEMFILSPHTTHIHVSDCFRPSQGWTELAVDGVRNSARSSWVAGSGAPLPSTPEEEASGIQPFTAMEEVAPSTHTSQAEECQSAGTSVQDSDVAEATVKASDLHILTGRLTEGVMEIHKVLISVEVLQRELQRLYGLGSGASTTCENGGEHNRRAMRGRRLHGKTLSSCNVLEGLSKTMPTCSANDELDAHAFHDEGVEQYVQESYALLRGTRADAMLNSRSSVQACDAQISSSGVPCLRQLVVPKLQRVEELLRRSLVPVDPSPAVSGLPSTASLNGAQILRGKKRRAGLGEGRLFRLGALRVAQNLLAPPFCASTPECGTDLSSCGGGEPSGLYSILPGAHVTRTELFAMMDASHADLQGVLRAVESMKRLMQWELEELWPLHFVPFLEQRVAHWQEGMDRLQKLLHEHGRMPQVACSDARIVTTEEIPLPKPSRTDSEGSVVSESGPSNSHGSVAAKSAVPTRAGSHSRMSKSRSASTFRTTSATEGAIPPRYEEKRPPSSPTGSQPADQIIISCRSRHKSRAVHTNASRVGGPVAEGHSKTSLKPRDKAACKADRTEDIWLVKVFLLFMVAGTVVLLFLMHA